MNRTSLESIAIAGAWGYIGRKFLEAAQDLRLQTYVYDPGSLPEDLGSAACSRVGTEDSFYRLQADLFHLALHPQDRRGGLAVLLERSRHEPILVLCEKPMASPERPRECQEVVEQVDASNAVLLYDFPELFDPITQRIREFLAGFRHVTIDLMHVQRSKDREDPDNPRNFKRMVTIQYQESVHCLAFVLYVLGGVAGGLPAAIRDGIEVSASAKTYHPPNPNAYRHEVDGECEYRLTFGPTRVEGRTDFKRGAEWAKRRILSGRGDGRPFRIEADYLEERKRLVIDGVPQPAVVNTNSYAEVIRTMETWRRDVPPEQLMRGLYPNPRFAQVTYQLSSAVWRSSQEHKTLAFDSLTDLLAFNAGYAAAVPGMPPYADRESS